MQVKDVVVDDIVVPESRARSTFSLEQEAELEASMRAHGFVVPILVSPLPDGKYLLIDGEHRLAVARRLGLKTVPAAVFEGDERRFSLLNILANTARGTQDPIGISEQLKKCVDAGLSEDELAAATGHTRDWVRFYILLNELSDDYKAKLKTGELKVGHIREALRLPNPVEVDAALQSTLIHNWDVAVLHEYVNRRLPELREIYREGEPEQLPPPPTPEEAKEMVEYRSCMACGRTVKNVDMRMPAICQQCYDFLNYFAQQFHDTGQAMETLYKAYTFYMDAIQAGGKSSSQSLAAEVQAVTRSQPTSVVVEPVEGESLQVDAETLALARKIKLLREAGLI